MLPRRTVGRGTVSGHQGDYANGLSMSLERSKRSFTGCLLLFWLLCVGWLQPVYAGLAPTLKIEVDARDLPRRLVHSRIQVPCQAGKLKLWYPKWVPGTHGPYGPVQNVGGLRVQTSDGKIAQMAAR